MTKVDQLTVKLHGGTVGVLRRQGSGAFVFEPDATWEADRAGLTLSLAMRQSPGPRRGNGTLPAWFENLLPPRESQLRKLQERSSGRRTGWGLLGWLGTDLPGAVTVEGDAEDAPDEEEPPLLGRTSMGGMQLKVGLMSSGGRLSLPLAGEVRDTIAKLAPLTWPDLPRIEWATMQWAAACGIRVPPASVHAVTEVPALEAIAATCAPELYAIQRFDRQAGSRVHQEDLCQVFELAPTMLYGGESHRKAPRATTRSIARLIHRACGAPDAEEALRRVAFELVSGNLDAHLKNWALWYPDRVRPRLAPAYDQVCVVALPGFGWDQPTPPGLALSFAGSRSLVDLDRDRVRRWIAAADLVGVPAEEVFLDGVRTALARWREVRNEAPASMVSALALHHRAVPVIQSMS